MTQKILVLPGDGIGKEIVAEAIKVIDTLKSNFGLDVEITNGDIGGAAYDAAGHPYPPATQVLAKEADAILLGAVGGYEYEELPRDLRPERGLLGIRADLQLFSNLRPAILNEELADASSLRPEIVAGLDMMIVRELTGGIYFGEPRGIRTLENGERQGYNTLIYKESEIERIAHSAFQIAMKRGKRLCSVDKANVLEVMELWHEVIDRVAKEYPEVEVSHMYVDNASMQLVKDPKQFDVMVTGNMFGDILSDTAAMLTGSIGMLPSASLDANGKGMYEPIHGSAPDIAGKNIANPLATIMSVSMMLRYSLDKAELADKIDAAVEAVLKQGLRTADIYVESEGLKKISTSEMGDAVVAALKG
ncbi:3-isopropylmalate dehydrogenase [uncultured Cocleimonas sp.]|uniref:3-isopropylmalate dehydrogenase n=1 Tax=uncultured Cocleimonas sp. TaxID=1051587 RepID=UPI002637BE33|nr:3-isopropylmalate dehydrogenase [uncultured Cocleimonas sp.]